MSAQNTWFLHHSETSPNNNNSGDACSPNVMITPPSSSPSNNNNNTTNTTTTMDDENIHATKCTRYTHTILIYVNGIRYLIEHPNPEQTLGDYLRVNLQLTGTKIGCSEGGCGACVVMISHYDHQLNKIVNRSVNACLYPLIASDGCHIVTVEGVGTTRDDMLHLIQQRVAQFHASQCGFCTPGFVMSLYVLLRNNPHPTLEDVERSLDGNLCRCTGYRPILDAARSIIEEQSIKGCGKKDCCQLKNNNSTTTNNNNTTVYDQLNNSSCSSNDCNNESHNHSNSNNSNSSTSNLDKSDPLFPFELRSYKYKPLRCTSNIDSNRSIKWYRPITLEQFLEILQRYPKDDKRFIVGNTEIAIETRMKNKHFPIIIQPTHIKELLELSCIYDNDNNNNENDINNNNDNTNTDNNDNSNNSKQIKSLIIGSSITINNLEEFIKKQIKLLPSYQSQSLECILHQTKYFASTPIRNAACLAGNIITASPASDLNPLWVALDCNLKIMQMDGHVKTIPFKEFFTGYRQVQLKKSELLIHLEIPLPKQNNTIQLVKAFKQSKRREDDIAIVTSAMKIKLFKNNLNENINNNNNLNENINENLNENENINNKYYIQDVKLVYGGMNAYTISCEKTRQFLIGKELNDDLFKESIEYLIKDLPLAPNAPGGMIEYRKTLSLSFYYKFYLYILKELKIRNLDKEELSVLLNHHYIPRSFPKGEQFYNTIEINDSIGKSIQHQSSNIQVNGQAKYVDDIQPIYGQLYAALVQSTKPLAFIKSISYDKALQIKGVIGHVDYTDVKGHNRVGAVIPDDEELFISTKTTSIGQLIALIIAETPQQAKLASRLVVIEYITINMNINSNMNSNNNTNMNSNDNNTIEKPIFTIESAIKNNSYLLKEKKIVSSPDINTTTDTTNTTNTTNTSTNTSTNTTSNNKKITASDILKELENDKTNYLIVSGDSYTNGAQEHFYIEPVSTIVIPNQPEIGEYLVYCTTQAPTHTQMTVSEVLNVPSHKVVTRVKRLGGGFGGKESKPTYFSAAIAVAAQKYQRPIKLTLDRDIDMSSTGQRHPYYVKYKVAININDFKLKAIEMELFANGGYSMDLSESVLNRALQCADNCYYIPYSTIIGRICKTNTLSNTAFRGFGGPQGCMAMELILDHLSYQLSLNILQNNNNLNNLQNNNINLQNNNLQNNLNNLNNFIKLNNEISLKLRQVNFYTNENNITPYKMKIQDSNRIHLLWNETLKCSNYNERFKYIEEYNLNNRYRKRGLSIIPVKFGIAFGAPFLNQGGALIQIYFNDASVLLSIGGVCMGQGLFIKMIQCVSTTLGIPLEFIHISDTSTDKVPNTSATAASVSSDLYGQAVIKACQTLNNRLDSLKRKLFPHLYTSNNNSNNNNNINSNNINNNTSNNSNNNSNNSYNYNLDNSIIKEDLNKIIENDLERLPPKLTHKEWKELISAAYFQGDVSLSATGYYSTSKDVWMDWNKGEGKPFNYFTYGCAASEVEIDTLTGDWSVIRSDIVMDLGNSLNPAIDIGQIEGAFIQGMGLYTMEEFIYGDENHEWFPQGYVFTRGPGAYKIPSANDIPLQFNIHLLDSNNNIININNNTNGNTNNTNNTNGNNSNNTTTNNNENISSKINHKGTTATYGSKAVGEPPLFLGSSVYFAIKNAIKSARLDANLSQYFILDPPATTEKIRMACHDQFVSKFVNNSSNNSNDDENTTNEPYLRIKGSY